MRRRPVGRNRYKEVVGARMVWKIHSLEYSSPEEVLAESPDTEAVAALRSMKESGAGTVPNRVPGETTVGVRKRRWGARVDNGTVHIDRMFDLELEEALEVNRIQEQREVEDTEWDRTVARELA